MPARIYKAFQGSLGRVVRGDEISFAKAVVEYGASRDVLVCGDHPDTFAMGKMIASAVGPYIRQNAHTRTAGLYALPHFQPSQRPPDGHVFYETANRKAAKNP
jgi:hypothetical protein